MSLDLSKKYKFNKNHPRIIRLTLEQYPNQQHKNKAHIYYTAANGLEAVCTICDVFFLDKVFTLLPSPLIYRGMDEGTMLYNIAGYRNDSWRMEVPEWALVPATNVKYNPYKGKSY